jgi:hypothetical protein
LVTFLGELDDTYDLLKVTWKRVKFVTLEERAHLCLSKHTGLELLLWRRKTLICDKNVREGSQDGERSSTDVVNGPAKYVTFNSKATPLSGWRASGMRGLFA